MVERERNQRFLKDRDERLRQIFGKRAQPRAEAGAKKLSTSQMGDAVLAALDKVAGKQKERA